MQQYHNAKTILAKETKKWKNDFKSHFFYADDDKYLRDKGRYSVKITIAIALFIRSTLPSQKCKIVHFFICFFYRESEFLPRWEQVLEELKTKGIYDLTFEELEFGVRTAWRNAARCSARIQWENLVSIN